MSITLSIIAGEYTRGGSRVFLSQLEAGEGSRGGSRILLPQLQMGDIVVTADSTGSATSATSVNMVGNPNCDSAVTVATPCDAQLRLYPTAASVADAVAAALAQFAIYTSADSSGASTTASIGAIGVLGLANSDGVATTGYGHQTVKPVVGDTSAASSTVAAVTASYFDAAGSTANGATASSVRSFLSVVANSDGSAAPVGDAQLILFLGAPSAISGSTSAIAQMPHFAVANSDGVITALASGYRLLVVEIAAQGAANSQAQSATVYFLSAQSIAEAITGSLFIADFTDGWAYNLNTGAASFYEDFKFNSFALIDGQYFGANASGIFAIGGNDDDGADINAVVTLGKSDLDAPTNKRVPAVYASAESELPLRLTCRVEGEAYTYELDRETGEMSVSKAKPGKGLSGVYWELEVSNQQGADFTIDKLEIITEPGKRRV